MFANQNSLIVILQFTPTNLHMTLAREDTTTFKSHTKTRVQVTVQSQRTLISSAEMVVILKGKGFRQENCGTLGVGVVFFLLFLFFLKLLNLAFPLKKILKRNKPEMLPLVKF